MKIYRVQDFVVKGKEVFLGLEDSKTHLEDRGAL